MLAAGVIALGAATGCASTFPTGTGVVSGHVVFAVPAIHPPQVTGVVRVLDATGRLVAHQKVSPAADRFRFSLTPGRYEVKLEVIRGILLPGCSRSIREKSLSVQGGDTATIMLPETCAGGY